MVSLAAKQSGAPAAQWGLAAFPEVLRHRRARCQAGGEQGSAAARLESCRLPGATFGAARGWALPQPAPPAPTPAELHSPQALVLEQAAQGSGPPDLRMQYLRQIQANHEVSMSPRRGRWLHPTMPWPPPHGVGDPLPQP